LAADVEPKPEHVQYFSKEAGLKSLYQGAISRAFLPFPVIYFPQIIKEVLLKTGYWPKTTIPQKLIEIVIAGLVL
jgi:hypothetical protein